MHICQVSGLHKKFQTGFIFQFMICSNLIFSSEIAKIVPTKEYLKIVNLVCKHIYQMTILEFHQKCGFIFHDSHQSF